MVSQAGPPDFELISKRGCHLCDEVEREMRSILGDEDGFTVLFIDDDPVLFKKYWDKVPVVTAPGKDLFEATAMDLNGNWRKSLQELLRHPPQE